MNTWPISEEEIMYRGIAPGVIESILQRVSTEAEKEIVALGALKRIMVAIPDITAEEIILAADVAKRKPYFWNTPLPAVCPLANGNDQEAAGMNGKNEPAQTAEEIG